tara:strand:+ start:2413 stop:2760 length:348 start_codon:yes stop_codon:yes gene_type:complete
MNLIKSFLLLLSSVNSFHLPLIEHLPTVKQIAHNLPYETRVKIVEEATGILPKLDFFGHLVLSNNEKVIDYIIHTPLTEEQKKEVILKVIEICRKGDEMGGKILLNYYNLIDNIL